MSEILSNAVVVITILAGFAALVRWVRRDTFSGTLVSSGPDDKEPGTSGPGLLDFTRSRASGGAAGELLA
jgi:hypothetical protein